MYLKYIKNNSYKIFFFFIFLLCNTSTAKLYRKCFSQKGKVAILSLEDSHFVSRENMHVSHQNSQTAKEIRANRYLNVFRPLCFILTYCKVIVHFCHSFNLHPLIFVGVFSKTLIVNYVVFPM